MLTILTPTYNRCDRLVDLYNSLCKQTVKSFEWLIVDDGSNDDTKSVVDDMASKVDFSIRYIYKENGGKHTALNVGIAAIENELTFPVDSDDILTENAVETVLKYHERYKNADGICGYAFLRQFTGGGVNGNLFSSEEKIATYVDARINSDDTKADKAEVFYTKCLKEFPFPEYKGEKFLGEDIVWIRMAQKYSMVNINEVIYIGTYLESGLTKNRRKCNIFAPVGCMNRAKEFMRRDVKTKYRVKGAIQYVAYGKFAKKSMAELLEGTTCKALVICCAPAGYFFYHVWKAQYIN